VRAEEGFTLVEALVSTGLLALAVTGFMACCLTALRAVHTARVDDEMDLLAHNALVDMYAVTAYDGEAANALMGQTRTYRSGVYTVRVNVAAQGEGKIVASVHVSDGAGHASAMSGILAQAAPAPGSFLTPGYAFGGGRR
jgi:Tfp pilus assembly protein PilV